MRPTHLRTLLTIFLAALSAPAFAQVDLSGNWIQKIHEDWMEQAPGPDLVDYLGLPINDAGRTRALSHAAAQISLPERQCLFYAPNYLVMGPQNLRFWPDTDEATGQIVAWVIGPAVDRGMHTIWMDGRPRPSDIAPRPIGGFTTGTWDGETLTTVTTHMREGYLRRNGVPISDEATLTLHITRHGDTLTIVGRMEDPAYLTEAFVVSRVYVLNPSQNVSTSGTPCTPAIEVPELDGRGGVPHYLPGENPALTEMSKTYGIPQDAVLGGAETMYPEFQQKLRGRYQPPSKCTRYCCGWEGNGSAALAFGCEVTAAP